MSCWRRSIANNGPLSQGTTSAILTGSGAPVVRELWKSSISGASDGSSEMLALLAMQQRVPSLVVADRANGAVALPKQVRDEQPRRLDAVTVAPLAHVRSIRRCKRRQEAAAGAARFGRYLRLSVMSTTSATAPPEG